MTRILGSLTLIGACIIGVRHNAAQESFTYTYDNIGDLASAAGFDAGDPANGGMNDGVGLLDYVASSVLWDVGEPGSIFLEESGNPVPQPRITLSLDGGSTGLHNVVIYYFERTSSAVSSPEEITATVGAQQRTITSAIGEIDDSNSDGPGGFGDIRVAGIDLSGLTGDAIQLDFINTSAAAPGCCLNGSWTGITEIVVNDPTFVFPELPLQLIADRSSGELSIANINSTPVELKGYSITSTAGSLTPSNWTSVADHYDSDGPDGDAIGSVDDDNAWTKLTADAANSVELSEFQFGVGDGGAIPADSTISLGAAAWLQTPFDDLSFTYVDPATSEILNGIVRYAGESLVRSDLDADGDIDQDDWTAYVGSLSADLSAATAAAAYRSGDLDGDFDNDLDDLNIFKADFDSANGPGAFVAMISAVPEPSAVVLLGLAAIGGVLAARPRGMRAGAAMGLLLCTASAAEAQLYGLYRFEDGDAGVTLGVGEVLVDGSRKENDGAVFAGTVDLVNGQTGFGNAAQFTNGVGQALLAGAGTTVDDFAVAF
ncbi:MAG: PEP-CTERM sorting domain-containing protein, partial [Planctomycetota bacterium]